MPPRKTVTQITRARWIPPHFTSVHTPIIHGVFQGARPVVVIGHDPPIRRLVHPIAVHTTPTGGIPPPTTHNIPRVLIIRDPSRARAVRPTVIFHQVGRLQSPIGPRPPLVVQIWHKPAPLLATVVKKLHARTSIQPFPHALVGRIPVQRQRRLVIITATPAGGFQARRPGQAPIIPPMIVKRFHPALWKPQTTSTHRLVSQVIKWRTPIIVPRVRAIVRTPQVIQIDSGAGLIVPKPIRPLIVTRPPGRRLLYGEVTPKPHYLLQSPALHGPMPHPMVFGRLRGRGSVEQWFATSYPRVYVINPEQPIPGVNPPPPGGNPTPLDLVAACIAWLRLNVAIVAAFGDTIQTEKFGSDLAARGTSPPYLEFFEPEEDETYETIDATGLPSSVTYGLLGMEIIGSQAMGKLGTRQLAEQVVAALNDAPLTFLDGVLLYLRRANRRYPTFKGQGPGQNIIVWKRAIEFRYEIERWAPQF